LELLKLLADLEAQFDTAEAKNALAEYESKGGITLETIKRELGIDQDNR
jgi:hypothetical protein